MLLSTQKTGFPDFLRKTGLFTFSFRFRFSFGFPVFIGNSSSPERIQIPHWKASV